MAVSRLILRHPVIYRVLRKVNAPRHKSNCFLVGSLMILLIHSHPHTCSFCRQKPKKGGGKRSHSNSPEILIHRLEEEFVVRLIQDLLKIQQSYILSSNGDLHQIRRLLFVDVINNFGFRHGCSFFWPRWNSPPERD